MTCITKVKTEENYPYIEFRDFDGFACSLQISSLDTTDCIRLGIDDPDPKIFTHRGWQSYSLPAGVSFRTRMHLSQEQVRELLPYLLRFASEGELWREEESDA